MPWVDMMSIKYGRGRRSYHGQGGEEKKKKKKKFACSEEQDDYFVRYIPPAKSDLIGV